MSKADKKVLLAEPDIESAKVLGKALKERGFEVLYAKDGPKALQHAVGGAPDVMVSEISLPLLNAVKIAQILKSNPKSKDMPIVFLSSGVINPAYLPYFQNTIVKKPYNVDEVLTRIDACLFKREKSKEVQVEAKEIEGNLAQMSLVDILQIFGMNKKSGALVIRREDVGQEGMVFLKEGEIINATSGAASGEKALYRLLSWEAGKFEYIPKDFHPGKNINKPTDSLLMEGMRQLDEWRKMEAQFPSVDAPVFLKIDPSRIPKNLRPATKDVLSLLSYYKNVGQILDNSIYPDYEVMMTLQTLISKGVVETGKEPSTGKKVQPLLTAEEAFAIKDSLKNPFREGYDMDIVKIPVFYENFDHLKKLSDLLSGIDSFNTERKFFQDHKGESLPLGKIGSIKASDNITLLFTAFPADSSYSPLWPSLLIDSVGMVMLRSGDGAPIADIAGALKSSMGLNTAVINADKEKGSMETRDYLQLNMWEVDGESSGKTVHKLLDYFLSL